jgi:hypothetical protein
MKITGETLKSLELALIATLKAHGLHPFMVQNSKHAWEVFHKSWSENRIDGHALYREFNDSHIETALKKIFRSYR